MNLKPYQIESTDHIELWKYFSLRADELKNHRWTIVTWMLGICIGLTAFILKTSGVIEKGKVVFSIPWIIVLIICLALLLTYTLIIWFSYGEHISRNHERSVRMCNLIIPLKTIIDGPKNNKSESKKLPQNERK